MGPLQKERGGCLPPAPKPLVGTPQGVAQLADPAGPLRQKGLEEISEGFLGTEERVWDRENSAGISLPSKRFLNVLSLCLPSEVGGCHWRPMPLTCVVGCRSIEKSRRDGEDSQASSLHPPSHGISRHPRPSRAPSLVLEAPAVGATTEPHLGVQLGKPRPTNG